MRNPEISDPDLLLADLLMHWPETIPVFMRHNMLCVGCLVAPFHTVEDACVEYGLDPEAFLNELIETLDS